MTLLDAHPIVLITGISASGKSTVAELLAQRFDRETFARYTTTWDSTRHAAPLRGLTPHATDEVHASGGRT